MDHKYDEKVYVIEFIQKSIKKYENRERLCQLFTVVSGNLNKIIINYDQIQF